MRIAIEADRAHANCYGIGRYVREILQSFSEDFPEHKLLALSLARQPVRLRRPYSPLRLLRGFQRRIWLGSVMPWQIRRWGADVLFCPDYLTTPFAACPTVVTIHDLMSVRYPQWGEHIINWELRTKLPSIVRKAQAVVVPTEAMRTELLETFDCPASRVHVVHYGVSKVFAPVERRRLKQLLAGRLPVDQPYLLCVGSCSPRKNIPRILEAFVPISKWYKGSLVMVGGAGWAQQPLERLARRLELEKRICWLGFVSDEELTALYSHADAFLFPSLYEGFGLPVFEAMACGCPVITSSTGALREIAGEAALLVDPNQTGQIIAAIEALLRQPQLRRHYQVAGLSHSRSWTWKRTASCLLSVFETVLARTHNSWLYGRS